MYMCMKPGLREDLLSKLSYLKKIGYNCTILQETLFVPSIEVGETNTFKVTKTIGSMIPKIHYMQLDELP